MFARFQRWAGRVTRTAQFSRPLLAGSMSIITTDQRLSYQQTVSNFTIAVLVLVARRNKLEFLRPLVPEIQRVVGEVRPGEVRRIGV